MPSSPIEAIKKNFFDRENIVRLMDSAIRGPMSRFGAFVRTRARTSIRKRKATSQPGMPPSSHAGTLKRLILFSYEPEKKTVVIGALAFKPSESVPQLLEYGGTGTTSKFVNRRGQERRKGIWQARPYMRPAFAAELPGFLQSLKDSL